MINEIKKDLKEKVGKEVLIVINEGRSKNTKTKGIIKKLYSNIFIIEIDGTDLSFSYSDVLTKKIIFK